MADVPARVGFLGLGLMGSRMATALARKGFQVVVWNRTRARADALAILSNVTVAATPAELAAQVDAFCTCVADPAALEQVTRGPQGLLAGARKGQLFVDFSTISPDLARTLEAECAAAGLDFVEAPVTGSKLGAEKGTLLMMVGASPHSRPSASGPFTVVRWARAIR
jgi:3-hydroxyisobutyrate dehydrogenase-like beta-hydroxyacid dehydrogenase